MPSYHIFDDTEIVGSVHFVRSGLYYDYKATVRTSRTDFIRLYGHSESQTIKLGLFIREGDDLCCHGRISARSLKNDPESMRYSLQNVPLLYQNDTLFTPNLRLWTANGRRFVIINHENSLPDEVMPYFCFLKNMEINGTFYLGFEVDCNNKPKIPN